ncbi:hypothetical protein Tco_0055899 [Tanacetum coccineum]
MEEESILTQNTYSLLNTIDKHGLPPTKRLVFVHRVTSLTRSPHSLVHGESLEIHDYQLCAIWKDLGYSEWYTPAGLKLARENLQSRVKEEDSITDVENAVFDLGVMDSQEDSITDVENAVFDLGVMDSLCFLFIDQIVFIGMITKFI